jgi:hypothetical protein
MQEFCKYFESEKNLEQLFIDYKELIDSLNEYRGQFLANVLTSEEDLKIALAFYTGAIQTLQPLYQVAQAYKESQEDAKALELRNQAAESKEKITDATIKYMAHYEVRTYIKVRNVLEALVIGCEKGISTCQTLLKYSRKDASRVQE